MSGRTEGRTAVIVIHGIGEQLPMETLRSFVDSLVDERKAGDSESDTSPAYYSKPDAVSHNFELRRLIVRGRPTVDFYEYYWAHRVVGTKMLHVRAWLQALLLRTPWRIPKHLRPLWLLLWTMLVAVVALWIQFARGQLGLALPKGLAVVPDWAVPAIGTLFLGVLAGLMIDYIGDAARYLRAAPANVAIRQSIRSAGVRLLKELHDPEKGYTRIVVVGHSLGSVIAYDIVTNVWATMNTKFDKPARTSRRALTDLENQISLANAENTDAKLLWDVGKWQTQQHSAWQELRELGNPWLVTDLVTLGSPLAHAGLLMAKDERDLLRAKRYRELSTCPPTPEGKSSISYDLPPRQCPDGSKTTLAALHHAAAFAVTRWTNLYFPAKWGIFGDLVGGPVAPVFGQAVRDVPVKTGKWFGLFKWIPVLPHVMYWRKLQRRAKSESHISALKRALDLRLSRAT